PFVSMQNHYNLVYREEEREMIPYCLQEGIALTPWSPLARGILAGAYRGGFEGGSTARSQGRDRQRTQGLYRGEAVFPIADRVIEVADRIGKTPAQVSLAWVLSKPGVVAPIVGASKVEQIRQLIEAADIILDAADIAYLEAPYQPVENLLSIGYS
ncbi:MAG: aldo/keto reductase, partial [Burkholderiales bacterium]